MTTNKFIKTLLFIFYLMSLPLFSLAQFGADYSSYGFNFVNNTHNDGLNGWQSDDLNNTSKVSMYNQSTTQNNYVLELKAQNDTVQMSYDDSGYMDLNSCSFVINLRLNIPQFTGNTEGFALTLYTGSKLVHLQFKDTGIYYLDDNNNYTYITAAPVINQWFTYTISLDSCSVDGELMIENDSTNLFALSLPNNTNSQSIEMYNHTTGGTVFEVEIDHLMIYSNPIKWWLGPSVVYVDENNYIGTTGDRQHYLSLPNGERVGINENAGGYMTYTQLYAGGPNLYPRPKFGSGGTKTLRGYFHGRDYNPVQAGAETETGGHLATVNASAGQLEIEPFPLHLYYSSKMTENNPLVFPSGDTMANVGHRTFDDDVYDEFGLDMRHELMTELDFSSTLDDVSTSGGISVVKHFGEWEFIRHPCQVLQFHDPKGNQRFSLDGTPHSDSDMGQMRHKFEFRMNKYLGYEWVLWRENGQWDSLHLVAVKEKQTYASSDVANVPLESRFMIFSTSSSLSDTNAIAWYYPESIMNANCTVQKSRTDKSVVSQEDRRFKMSIISDWRKTNWCRMNLYIVNEGLLAPNHGDPNTYESFQMEAYQLFGTPNQIWARIQITPLPVELLSFEVAKTSENQVSIQWKTATETNNDFFTLERSKDGQIWVNIKKINGAGNSLEIINYTEIDESPLEGVSFYRLKQTDFDGTTSFSETKSVVIKTQNKTTIDVFPNPTDDQITIKLNGTKIKKMALFDAYGKNVLDKTNRLSADETAIILSLNMLPTCFYYLAINDVIVQQVQKY